MRITIAAVGRLKAGAERTIAERYRDRAVALGRGLGVSLTLRELPEARGGSAAERMSREAAALAEACPPGDALAVLDRTGKSLSSNDFAELIGRHRDRGRDLSLIVGGADGIDPGLRHRADLVVSLGAMTWPHQLARLMLLEQIYRALAIIAGHPYHRSD
jgi:23S rRNA (pseudouridine1915-N3)-methyltransferase